MFQNKTKALAVVILLLFLAGCSMFAGNVPWYQDIPNWTPYQKADFFMNVWLAEKRDYDTMNEMKNKPEQLIKVLQTKRKVLNESRVPIRTYSQLINSGGVPSQSSEQEIITWIRQLQVQYLYGGE